MNRTPDDQLSKAAIKANLETLRYLERQQVKTAATIDTLRDMLIRAGVSMNGASALPTPEPARDASLDHVKAVVKRAKARFAAAKVHRRAPALGRRTPQEWQDAILRFLTEQGKPVTPIQIRNAFGGGNTAYHHIAKAVKARTIVKVGEVPRNGMTRAVPLYGLAGRTPARTAKKPQAKKPRWGNKTKEQRARSLAILSAFDTEEPRPNPPEHTGKIAKLISYGYLKRRGEGYVRTAKEFVV